MVSLAAERVETFEIPNLCIFRINLTVPPRVIVIDKLRSYYAPCKSLLHKTEHRKHKRLNNIVENVHQPTRRRERQMTRFKSAALANRFAATHGQVRNLFMVGRC